MADPDGLADHGRGACARQVIPSAPWNWSPCVTTVALALRGIAMAQLGDLVRAKALLRRAARGFGPKRCSGPREVIVAEAEIALVSRDLTWPAKALDAARAALGAHGDCKCRACAQISRSGVT